MGNTLGMLADAWPPAPTYSADDVPDLTGKVMLVTGGNAGVGKETAKVLLQHNAKVYIACRSAAKARDAAEELKKLTGKTDGDLHVLILDLANLPTIKSAVAEFLQKETRLDTLFNSAGLMWPPLTELAPHGHDLQFGTMVLGHFYLTQLLLPTLIASAKTSPDGHARIVNVSSNGHWSAPTIKQGGPVIYSALVDSPERNKLGTQSMYFQSKAANVMMSNALARKYGDQGIISTSLNPGGIRTDLQRYTNRLELWIIDKFFLNPPSLGALTPLYAGTAPEVLNLNGKYFSPWARLRSPRPDMENIEKQEELWTYLEGEVKKYGA